MQFYIPGQVALVSAQGLIDDTWRRFLELLATTVTSQGVTLATLPGANRWALADQPTLGVSDAGYVAFVTDYGHFVRWTGTVWEFAPGDVGNGFFRDFAITPQEVGWYLCDGTATDYLVVGGATLTTAAITPPNLAGSPAYRKSSAAYTGTIQAASGATSSDGAHTHTGTTDNAPNIVGDVRTVGAYDQYGFSTTQHSHTFTTGSNGAHTHGPGTLDPAHLDVKVYFRR